MALLPDLVCFNYIQLWSQIFETGLHEQIDNPHVSQVKLIFQIS